MIDTQHFSDETLDSLGDVLSDVHVTPFVANFLSDHLSIYHLQNVRDQIRLIADRSNHKKCPKILHPRLVRMQCSMLPHSLMYYNEETDLIPLEERGGVGLDTNDWIKVPVMYCPVTEPRSSLNGNVGFGCKDFSEYGNWLPPMTPFVWKASDKAPVLDITKHWYFLEDSDIGKPWERYRLRTNVGDVWAHFLVDVWNAKELSPFTYFQKVLSGNPPERDQQWTWFQTLDWIIRLTYHGAIGEAEHVRNWSGMRKKGCPLMYDIRKQLLGIFQTPSSTKRPFYDRVGFITDELLRRRK